MQKLSFLGLLIICLFSCNQTSQSQVSQSKVTDAQTSQPNIIKAKASDAKPSTQSQFEKREARDPEASTARVNNQLVEYPNAMISAANPYAVQAGINILKQGGTAMDAAVAIQAMLTLVEPQSSGIGGGAFILYWDQQQQKLFSVDGRETAPAKATEQLFFENGKPVRWHHAVVGGRSVGVPGVLAALEMGQQQWGKLKWSQLFKETIQLSEQGFIVSPRLAKLIELELNPGLKKLAAAHQYFYPNGQPLAAGDLKKNPLLAQSLTQIAEQGASYFYQGKLANNIVAAVQHSEVSPGLLSLGDLADYQAKLRPAICDNYHAYQVCGFGPPSSGGISTIQILKLLEPFNLAQYQPSDWQANHLFVQASKLAFADRNQYIADSDFVATPVTGLLNHEYLKQRSQLISLEKDLGRATAGQLPNNISKKDFPKSDTLERPSTSHISIVDQWGNAVAMTTSIEMAFGSTVMVDGFLLNNQLTDFSFSPQRNGELVANRVEALKRPRSSMSPTMVFKDKQLVGVLGSPGGSRIIDYVSQALIAKIDWQLSIQQAVDLAKITNMNGDTSLEANTHLVSLKPKLEALGHKVNIRDLNSGLHAIWRSETGWQGAADPRREGKVMGF